MDAWVILRHKRDGASFSVLAGEEVAVADRRTKGAINNRWTTHLKILMYYVVVSRTTSTGGRL